MNCPSIDSDRQSFLFFEINTIAIGWFDSSIISILSFLIPRLGCGHSEVFVEMWMQFRCVPLLSLEAVAMGHVPVGVVHAK